MLHALDVALRKALLKYFPYLEPVKVIETYQHATGASTEADVVSVKKFADGDLVWTDAGQVVEHDRVGMGVAARRLRMANHPGERAAAADARESKVVEALTR